MKLWYRKLMMKKEIRDFFLHLRLHYNFVILSAPFLLGAVYVGIQDVPFFLFYFLVVYVLLFGGANAYNSYFDKDEGPIGGLKHPPKMKKWMLYASWLLQLIGLALSFGVGYQFVLLYVVSMVASWAYSDPLLRLKARPIGSLLAIAIGVTLTTTGMGYFAAGGKDLSLSVLIGAVGNTLLVLSMYPFSQIYQIQEDIDRGFQTFTVRYGISGVKTVFKSMFVPGILLVTYSLHFMPYISFLLLIAGLLAAWYIGKQVNSVKGDFSEYEKIMNTKYFCGFLYTVFVVTILVVTS